MATSNEGLEEGGLEGWRVDALRDDGHSTPPTVVSNLQFL